MSSDQLLSGIRPSLSGTGRTNQTRKEIEKVIQMYQKKELSKQNAFDIKITSFDELQQFLKEAKEDTRWLKVGQALGASAHLYGHRVDHVHTNIYKMIGTLARNDSSVPIELEEQEEDDSQEEDEDGGGRINSIDQGGPTTVKKKAIRTMKGAEGLKTLARPQDIDQKDIERMAVADPLFKKLCRQYDELSYGNLMTSILQTDSDLLIQLDSQSLSVAPSEYHQMSENPFKQPEQPPPEEDEGSYLHALNGLLASSSDDLVPATNQISPDLSDYIVLHQDFLEQQLHPRPKNPSVQEEILEVDDEGLEIDDLIESQPNEPPSPTSSHVQDISEQGIDNHQGTDSELSMGDLEEHSEQPCDPELFYSQKFGDNLSQGLQSPSSGGSGLGSPQFEAFSSGFQESTDLGSSLMASERSQELGSLLPTKEASSGNTSKRRISAMLDLSSQIGNGVSLNNHLAQFQDLSTATGPASSTRSRGGERPALSSEDQVEKKGKMLQKMEEDYNAFLRLATLPESREEAEEAAEMQRNSKLRAQYQQRTLKSNHQKLQSQEENRKQALLKIKTILERHVLGQQDEPPENQERQWVMYSFKRLTQLNQRPVFIRYKYGDGDKNQDDNGNLRMGLDGDLEGVVKNEPMVKQEMEMTEPEVQFEEADGFEANEHGLANFICKNEEGTGRIINRKNPFNVNIDLAMVQRHMDVKRLKQSLWEYMKTRVQAKPLDFAIKLKQEEEKGRESSPESIKESEDELPDALGDHLRMKDMVYQVHSDESNKKNISVNSVFICMLHLANENNLVLESVGERDAIIMTDN